MSFTANSRLEHGDKRENNQGSLEEKRPAGVGGGGAALARELTCHSSATCCSPTKEPHQRERVSQLRLLGGEGSRRSSMTTLSSMNTIYAAGSLFSPRPPPHSRPPTGLALPTTFTGSRLLPPSSVSAFYLLKQERDAPRASQID